MVEIVVVCMGVMLLTCTDDHKRSGTVRGLVLELHQIIRMSKVGHSNTQLHSINGVLVMHFNNSPTTDQSLSLRHASKVLESRLYMEMVVDEKGKSCVSGGLLWPPSTTASSSPILASSMA